MLNEFTNQITIPDAPPHINRNRTRTAGSQETGGSALNILFDTIGANCKLMEALLTSWVI